MKKLYLITDIYPFGKGEITFILPELEYLRKAFDVTIISCGPGKQTAQVPENVKLMHYTRSLIGRTLGMMGSLFDPLFWREIGKGCKVSGLRSIKRCMISASDARHFGRWITKNTEPADIIYSFWHLPPLLGVLRRKKKLGSPIVIARAHGYDLYHYRTPEGYQPYKHYCDRLLDRIYLVSQAGYDYYMEHYSVSEPPKCYLRHLGADNDRLSPYEPGPVLRVFSCSNLLKLKRVDLIIEALALLDIPVEWIHFGGGQEEQALRALAASRLDGKPACKYTFTGHIPNPELRDYVAAHPFDCFITASSTEGGVPVSIAEAASFGIPSVATDAGGICELVNERTGILLPLDASAQDIADALLRIKSLTPEQTEAMRSAVYTLWKEKFVASDNARRFCDELLELCGER